MKKWNFILEGKLIEVYSEEFEAAERLAHVILNELKETLK